MWHSRKSLESETCAYCSPHQRQTITTIFTRTLLLFFILQRFAPCTHSSHALCVFFFFFPPLTPPQLFLCILSPCSVSTRLAKTRCVKWYQRKLCSPGSAPCCSELICRTLCFSAWYDKSLWSGSAEAAFLQPPSEGLVVFSMESAVRPHLHPSTPSSGCYGVAESDVREEWSCDRCTEENFAAVRHFGFFFCVLVSPAHYYMFMLMFRRLMRWDTLWCQLFIILLLQNTSTSCSRISPKFSELHILWWS